MSGITPYPEIPALTLSDGFTATWNLPHVPFCGCNIGDKGDHDINVDTVILKRMYCNIEKDVLVLLVVL